MEELKKFLEQKYIFLWQNWKIVSEFKIMLNK